MTLKYRELKRRYELDGAEQTVAHLSEALASRPSAAGGFQHPRSGRGAGARRPRVGADARPAERRRRERAGSGRRRRCDRVSEHHRPGDLLEDHGGLHAGGVRRLEARATRFPRGSTARRFPASRASRDTIDEVAPGMPYPHLGFGEDYIETPSTTKRGFIVPVTKEAIFFDRTHLVLSRAAEVGEVLGLNKEKRLIDLVIGVTNNYKWKGTTYNTYQTATPWINSLGGERAGRLDERRRGRAVVRRHSRSEHGRAGAGARHDGAGDAGLSARGPSRVQRGGDHVHGGRRDDGDAWRPIRSGNYRVHDSRLAYRRIVASGVAAADAKKWWFVGDFRRAFAYMENWPITVTQAPLGSEAEFNNDVVLRFKASERGAAAVLNPRYVVKNTG